MRFALCRATLVLASLAWGAATLIESRCFAQDVMYEALAGACRQKGGSPETRSAFEARGGSGGTQFRCGGRGEPPASKVAQPALPGCFPVSSEWNYLHTQVIVYATNNCRRPVNVYVCVTAEGRHSESNSHMGDVSGRAPVGGMIIQSGAPYRFRWAACETNEDCSGSCP